jgi:hypothetical protein
MYSLHTPAENKDERQREKTDQKGGKKQRTRIKLL